jgi:hypothetical protein
MKVLLILCIVVLALFSERLYSQSLSIQAYVVYDNGQESQKNKLLTYQTQVIELTESLSS